MIKGAFKFDCGLFDVVNLNGNGRDYHVSNVYLLCRCDLPQGAVDSSFPDHDYMGEYNSKFLEINHHTDNNMVID